VGENVAEQFLRRKGFAIVERNYRKPWGEIDIIAEKGGVVRFVEVKAVSREMDRDFSRGTSAPMPEELAHHTKLEKVARTAQIYMESKRDTREYQVDVVAVYLNVAKRTATCTLYEQVL